MCLWTSFVIPIILISLFWHPLLKRIRWVLVPVLEEKWTCFSPPFIEQKRDFVSYSIKVFYFISQVNKKLAKTRLLPFCFSFKALLVHRKYVHISSVWDTRRIPIISVLCFACVCIKCLIFLYEFISSFLPFIQC